jgi:hypothetical protein
MAAAALRSTTMSAFALVTCLCATSPAVSGEVAVAAAEPAPRVAPTWGAAARVAFFDHLQPSGLAAGYGFELSGRVRDEAAIGGALLWIPGAGDGHEEHAFVLGPYVEAHVWPTGVIDPRARAFVGFAQEYARTSEPVTFALRTGLELGLDVRSGGAAIGPFVGVQRQTGSAETSWFFGLRLELQR